VLYLQQLSQFSVLGANRLVKRDPDAVNAPQLVVVAMSVAVLRVDTQTAKEAGEQEAREVWELWKVLEVGRQTQRIIAVISIGMRVALGHGVWVDVARFAREDAYKCGSRKLEINLRSFSLSMRARDCSGVSLGASTINSSADICFDGRES
jgi:hypothetical protein